jgi:hypothetical protein
MLIKHCWNVSLLDSICLMKDAWDTVTPATVINCFWKSGLSSGEFSVGDQNINEDICLYQSG